MKYNGENSLVINEDRYIGALYIPAGHSQCERCEAIFKDKTESKEYCYSCKQWLIRKDGWNTCNNCGKFRSCANGNVCYECDCNAN